MRVLLIHPNMRIMGGGERVAIHSMLAATKAGNEVTLVSEEFDPRRFEDFFGCFGLFEKVRMISFPEFKPVLGSGLLYQRLLYYQQEFRKVLSREDRFDLVLGTQDVGYVPNVHSPVIQYCYFPEYFSHLESAASSPVWKLYYLPARVFYRDRARRIKRFLAVSDYSREYLKKIWGRDARTLYPPCPVDLYRSARGGKENLAVTVGRIVPSKRMNLFIDIARMHPKFDFIIVGSVKASDADYYTTLKRRAPDNVSFVISPLRKVRDVLGRAKVYIHCMENEHFGITIVEAMAAGCVPVVHDSGGPREIVVPGVGYRWRTPDEASAQVAKLMQDSVLRDKLSQAAEERSKLFSDETFETNMYRVFQHFES